MDFSFEEDAEGGFFFEEDFVGVFFEKFWEGREAFVDEDEVALVLVHELAHGAVGVVVVDEEAGDDQIDFGEGDFIVSADQGGDVGDLVFAELLGAEFEGGGGEVVDPDVGGVATEDEGFGSNSGSEDEDALV